MRRLPGRRYNRETLTVRYKGRSIADVLESSVDEALEILANVPSIRMKLQTLSEVGLGYVHLGQSATTFPEARPRGSSWLGS